MHRYSQAFSWWITPTFLTTPLIWQVGAPALIMGFIAVITGIAALRKRLPKPVAVGGIVTGALGFSVIAGAYFFALIFLGVFTTHPM